jgi:hypothetical protein
VHDHLCFGRNDLELLRALLADTVQRATTALAYLLGIREVVDQLLAGQMGRKRMVARLSPRTSIGDLFLGLAGGGFDGRRLGFVEEFVLVLSATVNTGQIAPV